MIEIIEFDGRCVKLKHLFRTETTSEVHRLESRRCKAEDGSWKLDFE